MKIKQLFIIFLILGFCVVSEGAVLQKNPSPFGWISYNTSTTTYTAYNNPVPDTTYCVEKNNVVTEKRTIWRFDTSGIGTDIISAAKLTGVRFLAVASPFLPPDASITYQINAVVGHDFIGSSVTTDDWGGGDVGNNIRSWGTTSPAINTNYEITIDPDDINKTGYTGIELKECCNYISIPSGSAVQFSVDNKNRSGLFYVQLQITYAPPVRRIITVE